MIFQIILCQIAGRSITHQLLVMVGTMVKQMWTLDEDFSEWSDYFHLILPILLLIAIAWTRIKAKLGSSDKPCLSNADIDLILRSISQGIILSTNQYIRED